MAQEVYRGSFLDEDPGAGTTFDAARFTSSGGEQVEFYFNQVAQKDYCKMVFPGNKLTVWDQPVREKDKQRFYQQWQLYKQGKDQFGGQTMLRSWSEIDAGSVEIYLGMNIQSVEALANLPDVNMTNMPPGHAHLAYRHREMAQEYVRNKRQSAGFDEAIGAARESAEIAKAAQDKNVELEAQIQELQRRLDAGQQGEVMHYPRHIEGRGFGAKYELSDGSIVKGKKAAKEAEEALHT